MMKIISIPLLSLVVLTGCASFSVSDDVLRERTAFALHLKENNITINNRHNSLRTAHYDADTRDGRRFKCSVTLTFPVPGVELPHCTESIVAPK